MIENTAVTTAPQAGIVPTDNANVELSASCPEEMVQCQQVAIKWCQNKIALVKNEASELSLAYEKAKRCKWDWKPLKRAADMALKRVTFYEKMLLAFESGYYIIPNFPVTLFAIRTAKGKPDRCWVRLRTERHRNFEQQCQILPPGEGTYQNPQPVIDKDYQSFVSNDKTGDTFLFRADEWGDLEFPANMSRLHVMDAATKAMDLKVFDEVGFLPADHKRNPDPVLVGRILDPRSTTRWNRTAVSFMIAWHIDTKNL